MARMSYTSAIDYMGLPLGELHEFWQALCRVLERENEAREKARNE